MTSNQINYGNYVESVRHNKVSETETQRHNTAVEDLTRSYNKASIDLGYAQLAETTRHNQAQESYNISYLNEVSRHNYATESIDASKVQLGYAQVALGYSQLGEQTRHNKQQERLSKYQTDANIYATDANQLNVVNRINADYDIAKMQTQTSYDASKYTADMHYQGATQNTAGNILDSLIRIFT